MGLTSMGSSVVWLSLCCPEPEQQGDAAAARVRAHGVRDPEELREADQGKDKLMIQRAPPLSVSLAVSLFDD
jgi:hypothetical protein